MLRDDAPAPDPIDRVLESVLASYRLRVEITADIRYCGHWYEREPAMRLGQFHLVTDGGCWIGCDTLPAPLRLERGDLVVLPTGVRHLLSSSPDPYAPLPPDSAETSLLCGEMEFDTVGRNPVLEALPACFVVRAADGGEAFRHLVDLLIATGEDRRWGQQAVRNKLADTLFTLAVCEYVRRSEQPRGLLAALTDTRLARPLSAMHERPGEDWTLAELARVAGMSRTAFAELFAQTVGQPPMQYLAGWRAAEARRLLHDRRLSVANIAERLGYRSEAAFRRFFKRLEGIGPGRLRAKG